MSDLFTVLGRDNQADTLARKLPDGQAFDAKYLDGCNLRNWLIALGLEISRFESYMNYVHNETELGSTLDLIVDYEKEYGMNSNCFADVPSGISLSQRINNILTLILSNGTSTEEQFEELATLLGFDVDVSCCKTGDPIQDRFVIYVDVNGAPPSERFTYTFPITFGDADATNVLECFFKHIKPAHTILVFNYLG